LTAVSAPVGQAWTHLHGVACRFAAAAHDALVRVAHDGFVGQVHLVVHALAVEQDPVQPHLAGQALQVAVQVPLAGQAILGMVGQQEVQHRPARVDGADGIRLHHHALRHRRAARRRQVRAAFDFHDADAAGPGLVFHVELVEAEVAERGHLDAELVGRFEDRGVFRRLDRLVVDGE